MSDRVAGLMASAWPSTINSGATLAAKLAKGAVGRTGAENAMAQKRSRPGHVAVGEVGDGVPIADQSVGDLVLDRMLKCAFSLATEI